VTVTGYATRESVRPGERIGFCVSQEHGEAVEFELVRLIHGDLHPDGPGLKETTIAHPANGSYPLRAQTMAAGSSAVVEEVDRLEVGGTWAVSVLVCPTLPGGAPQALVGRYDAVAELGWAVYLDAEGRVAARCGNRGGSGVVHLASPLVRGCWYTVSASFEADTGTVSVAATPAVTSTNSRLRQVPPLGGPVTSSGLPVGWASGPVPLRFAAVDAAGATSWHLNGKLERLRLTQGAPSDHGDGPVTTGQGVVAEWDFALRQSSSPIPQELVEELCGTGCVARLLNLPTRAVTSSAWDGSVHAHLAAPHHYAAVHFHDDDVGSADWDITVEVELPADLPSGIYAGRLEDSTSEHYVVFYVRPALGDEADVAFLVPTFSYRAYANDHCPHDVPFAQMLIGHTPVLTPADLDLEAHREYGLGLYDTHRDGSGVSLASRARPVLNLGPKTTYWLSPSVWQFNADLHLVDWLTERGTRFDVVTDTDLHLEGAEALTSYRVVLTGSHPEYASEAMLDALEAHLDAGRNLMYLGANGYYWVTALDPLDSDVIEVRRWGGSQAWKARPGEYHLATTGEMGGLWRNRGRPPQQLVGVGFVAEGLDSSSPYRRLVADDEAGAWVFDGTGVAVGELFGDHGLVGGAAAGLELDIIDEELGTPAEAVVLACSEQHTEAYFEALEELYFNGRGFSGPADPRVRADLTLVPLPSSATVFSTGSIAWCGALSHNDYDNPVSRLMGNVLDRFAGHRPTAITTADEEENDHTKPD
jgi:N,N-dimethylformamidase